MEEVRIGILLEVRAGIRVVAGTGTHLGPTFEMRSSTVNSGEHPSGLNYILTLRLCEA